MDRLTFPFTASEALGVLAAYVEVDEVLYKQTLNRFVALNDLDDTTGDAITWIRGDVIKHYPLKGRAGLIIAESVIEVPREDWTCWFITPDPHRAFFTLMWLVYGDGGGMKTEAYPTLRTRGGTLEGNVFGHMVIGKNISVGSNCTIGGPGFGHVPEMGVPLAEGERRWRVPHIGRVVIEDDVDVGDNTTINRGCLGDTIIRRGAKIDSHVFIAHNAEIGENAVVVAGAIICGSAKIGKGAWIAAGACVRNGVTVGEGATVGLMANVVKDVDPHTTVIGNPARPI